MLNSPMLYLLVLIATFFWGINFVLAGYVLADFSPNWSAATRFGGAALLLLGVAVWQGAALLSLFRRYYLIYIPLGVIGVTGFNLLFFYAMQTTSADNAALIMATNPLVTSLIAFLWLGERMPWNAVLALPIALIGVSIVVTHGNIANMTSVDYVLGDGLMLLANLCWALYNVLSRRFMPRENALANTALIIFSGAVALLLLALWHDGIPSLVMPSASGAIAMVIFILGGTVLAYLFWNMAIARLGAGKTALFMNAVPVFAFFAAILVGELPSSVQLLGGGIVLFGLFLGMWSFEKNHD
ncbi:MAG: DMT family transporter [Thiotrichales bacterium]|jgi:drug/metabolite transporter (DMT)-like permease|nr:DMT family transporter [Thiotrichales bacterium]